MVSTGMDAGDLVKLSILTDLRWRDERSGIEDLVAALHTRGKKVFLVSGGFRQIIEPVADILKIPRSRIFANSILYEVRAL